MGFQLCAGSTQQPPPYLHGLPSAPHRDAGYGLQIYRDRKEVICGSWEQGRGELRVVGIV